MKATAININGVWYLISEKFTEPAVGKSYYDGVGAIRIFGTGNCYDLRAVNIIAQSKTNDEGIPLFTPSWVEDILKLADDNCQNFIGYPGDSAYESGFLDGFYKGYNLAKEKYKYTQEDMVKAIDIACERKYRTCQIVEMISHPTYLVEIEQKDDVVTVLKYSKI